MEGVFGKRVLLAPMAGVSDIAFRSLCLHAGADLAFTEMVSAKGLSYANEKTRHLLDRAEGEMQVGVQIFGHEPSIMSAQAAWIEDVMGDALACIDINMGCPARKIVSKGDGSALMKTPKLAAEIVKSVASVVKHPVTVKFRRGYSEETGETAPAFAKHMEEAGAAAVCVHGRFSTQMYRGVSDMSTIARVKSSVSIPVIGNGDIKCASDAIRMIDKTGCDAIMVARGAQGNPWIFTQIKAALDGAAQPSIPTMEQRISMARQHAQLLSQREGRNIVRMRKHAMWYITGMPFASAARGRINQCESLEDFEELFDSLLHRTHIVAEEG
ncbi:tRNA dihydrouridine synthase DusB [Adlercreutzia sp. ZJ154]|uniref:tRNA dihydrouridine synthase DusB n=1 Tax=Adlercreutzia sp. ZJ154 TaxID=2709790 RepID=UPI0013ECAF2A|nr:tRNA dihydrouridine synthase DusB [Adlercreutzia sp. ZJ154]